MDIENVPIDDQKTFDLLAKGETTGLFQLNGQGMTKYLKELKPTSCPCCKDFVAGACPCCKPKPPPGMKIIAFTVRVECPSCKGEKHVPGGQREYGELLNCPYCSGRGHVEGYSSYADFAKLIEGVVRLSR